SLEADDVTEPLAERRGDGGVAPDRQQRVRQFLEWSAEMNIAAEHDVGGAQPRRWRHDALADTRGIDADDRRVLEDPGSGPPRQRRESMDIFAPIDMERLRIINAVKIAVGPELVAHTLDLPALYLGPEILVEHLQPADQLIAGTDIGHLERAFTKRN